MDNIIRDKYTNAIINTDKNAYESYLIAKRRLTEAHDNELKITKLEDEIRMIKHALGLE